VLPERKGLGLIQILFFLIFISRVGNTIVLFIREIHTRKLRHGWEAVDHLCEGEIATHVGCSGEVGRRRLIILTLIRSLIARTSRVNRDGS
jgi:hypothetical protein